jgi:hypothetical protein
MVVCPFFTDGSGRSLEVAALAAIVAKAPISEAGDLKGARRTANRLTGLPLGAPLIESN